MCRVLCLAYCLSLLAPWCCWAEAKTRIVFREIEGTGLAEILGARRALLERRKGASLKGHDWWLWGLSAFDYDGDDDLDLIVCIHGRTDGLIIKNLWKETGAMRFVDVTESLGVDGIVPSTDDYPLVWDFEGDGDLDIAGLLDDSPTPCLINHDGKRFTRAPFTMHPINHPAGVTDLDGDGYLDIYQTVRGKRIVCRYDPQAKVFRKSVTPIEPGVALPPDVEREMAELKSRPNNRFIKLKHIGDHDLNGDGKPDLIISGFGSYAGDRIGWYLIATDEGFVDRTEAMGLPRDATPFHGRDVDGDGDVDLLLASGARAGLYLNDGRGGFTLKPGPLTDFVKQRCPYLHKAFTADFDNDGDLDLAVSNRRYGRQKVFENLGGGEHRPVLESRGWDADPLVLADLNDDGRMDVIIGGAGTKENIGVFLNETPGAGRYCKLVPRMNGPNRNAVGAVVEIYAAGALKRTDDARPLHTAVAPPDGSPIHVGLGEAAAFDLRVTFPDNAPQVHEDITARPRLMITPDRGVRELTD